MDSGGQRKPRGGGRPTNRPGGSRGETRQSQQPAWGQQPRGQGSSSGSGVSSGGNGKPRVAGTTPSGPRHSAPLPVQGQGRASLHGVTKSGDAEVAVIRVGEANRGAMRGKRAIHEIIKTMPVSCTSKRGISGKEVTLQANYFRTLKKPTWTLCQYRVDFTPDIELLRVRKGILYSHKDKFGGYIFDGTCLFMINRLSNDPTELIAKNRDDEPIKITIKFVGTVSSADWQYLQILNLILRRSMEGLQLQLVGRNFFDAKAKIDLREFKIELWPGYTTSIRQHEQDILLNAEITHKVMRIETLYDVLQNFIRESRNYQDNFKAEVIGMVVLTDYNNKTYRVNDVQFNETPNSKFETKKGSISYTEYYEKRYGIRINDKKQPLLVSKSTDRDIRAGQTEFIMLIPELCRPTGINANMKNDFRLTRAMSDHTRLSPSVRIDRLKAFNRRLQSAPESVEVLKSWQLKLDENLVEMKGRILKTENIVFSGQRRVPAGDKADWSREFRNNSMFVTVEIRNWYVICLNRSQRETSEFVKSLKQAANGMRMRIDEPKMVTINDDRNNTYLQAIESCCSKDPQIILVIVPNNNAERYSSIKKKTYVDRAVPSQVAAYKTIAPKGGRGLMSVATKVAIQMNCKLMGAAWMIELPINGLMTIGFDVSHSARDKSKSYGAMVATMDLKVSAKYFSAVSVHNKGQELSNEIATNVAKAIKEYRTIHGTLPARIIFYRDGVGEGQFEQVYMHEVQEVVKRLDSIYKTSDPNAVCRFAFIIVSKRINSRFFLNGQNPPPGTVVDDIVTQPESYDFFLVSQSVGQGTVSPTRYNVIYDTLGLDADKIQMLTYKMTHLYYNWAGTTRVPAVCQYAHKLSFLVSQSIHQCPSNLLDKQLYFL